MKIYDVPVSELARIADNLGLRAEFSDVSNSRGHRASGRLMPPYGGPNPYPRISASPLAWTGGKQRRVWAVCWHGFRDYFRAVLTAYPTARIVTGMADYRGLSDFEERHRETGWANVGSQAYPVHACEACTCPESGDVSGGDKLAGLMAEATVSAANRGHRLTWARDASGAHASGVCACGRSVIVDTSPPPNGVDIGGEAVALNCPDADNLPEDFPEDFPGFRPAWDAHTRRAAVQS